MIVLTLNIWSNVTPFSIADEDPGSGLGTCPACGLGYDTGRRRMLVDSGRQMCYTCMFSQTEGPPRVTCPSPASSVRSAASTCHVSRAGRPHWAARHARRPNTVNMDDSTLSGEARGEDRGDLTNTTLSMLSSPAVPGHAGPAAS